ncbi:hypothetical protein C8R45DRAFT_160526 [Mycena sanguinolenta]|nr:hypothetical protein C8R45DRAFT_160526 [Mycena sanguinolenta]
MECNVLDNLTYLSNYLDESTARIRELENELATARRENDTNSRILQLQSENEDLHIKLKMKTEMLDTTSKVKQENLREEASRTLQLESDNADLRTQISSLRDNLKVKTEILDGVAEVKKESNVTDELVLRQAKITELQAQLKDTAELAAKALQERLEAAKALDESRKECADLQAANSALVAEGHASDERHATTCARLKSKIDKLKEERTNSREACSEQHAQVQSLTEKLSRAREKYEGVKIEHEDLKETMREMIELVESLQRDCKAKEDLTQEDNLETV